jgi:hypothetical protein
VKWSFTAEQQTLQQGGFVISIKLVPKCFTGYYSALITKRITIPAG